MSHNCQTECHFCKKIMKELMDFINIKTYGLWVFCSPECVTAHHNWEERGE